MKKIKKLIILNSALVGSFVPFISLSASCSKDEKQATTPETPKDPEIDKETGETGSEVHEKQPEVETTTKKELSLKITSELPEELTGLKVVLNTKKIPEVFYNSQFTKDYLTLTNYKKDKFIENETLLLTQYENSANNELKAQIKFVTKTNVPYYVDILISNFTEWPTFEEVAKNVSFDNSTKNSYYAKYTKEADIEFISSYPNSLISLKDFTFSVDENLNRVIVNTKFKYTIRTNEFSEKTYQFVIDNYGQGDRREVSEVEIGSSKIEVGDDGKDKVDTNVKASFGALLQELAEINNKFDQWIYDVTNNSTLQQSGHFWLTGVRENSLNALREFQEIYNSVRNTEDATRIREATEKIKLRVKEIQEKWEAYISSVFPPSLEFKSNPNKVEIKKMILDTFNELKGMSYKNMIFREYNPNYKPSSEEDKPNIKIDADYAYDAMMEILRDEYYKYPYISLVADSELKFTTKNNSLIGFYVGNSQINTRVQTKKDMIQYAINALSQINETMPVHQKVYLLGRYVMENLVYTSASSNLNISTMDEAYSLNEGVCKEYVEQLALLLSLANIRFKVYTGEQHTWLSIQDENENWFISDPTHSDFGIPEKYHPVGKDSSFNQDNEMLLFIRRTHSLSSNQTLFNLIATGTYKDSRLISESTQANLFTSKIISKIRNENIKSSALSFYNGLVYLIMDNGSGAKLYSFDPNDSTHNYEFNLVENFTNYSGNLTTNAVNIGKYLYFMTENGSSKSIYSFDLESKKTTLVKDNLSGQNFFIKQNINTKELDFFVGVNDSKPYNLVLSISQNPDSYEQMSVESIKRIAYMSIGLLDFDTKNQSYIDLDNLLKSDSSSYTEIKNALDNFINSIN